MIIEKYNNHSVERLLQIDTEAVEHFLHSVKGIYSQDDFHDIDNHYKNGEFFVALDEENNNHIIGTCAYLIVDDETAELKRIRVAAEMRGRGYGGILLQFIEEKIKERGLKRIILRTSSTRPATHHFYEKHGYIRTGHEEYGDIHMIIFEKDF
ncbi:MAG: GNAT family N-acetyltransferase [Lachnospiraceae bacterium]|nr:GNAT family N-acetyltransferase [Lachnospiraceae bacterium]